MIAYPLVTVKVSRAARYKAPHVVTVTLPPEADAACMAVDAPNPLYAYARGETGGTGRMPCTGAPHDYVAGAEDRRLDAVTGGLTFSIPHLEKGDTPALLAERTVRWARKIVADVLASVPTSYEVEITR